VSAVLAHLYMISRFTRPADLRVTQKRLINIGLLANMHKWSGGQHAYVQEGRFKG